MALIGGFGRDDEMDDNFYDRSILMGSRFDDEDDKYNKKNKSKKNSSLINSFGKNDIDNLFDNLFDVKKKNEK